MDKFTHNEENILLEGEEEIDYEEKKRGPLIYIIAIFLVFLIVMMIFPYYGIPMDPRPTHIPSVDEVMIPANISSETTNLETREDFQNFVVPESPMVKTVANRIVSQACEGERVCHAKAVYYFVRDNFDYIRDPVNFEYVEMPNDFILSGGGDCESGTLLMANFMEAVGIDSQLVFIPGHALLRIRLHEALSKYKRDGWVYLDWTCKGCEFGEITRTVANSRMSFLDVS